MLTTPRLTSPTSGTPWLASYEAHGGNVAEYGSPGYHQWVGAQASALPDPPAEVLDVASGSGYAALVAASLGHRVMATDLAPAMLEVLAEHATARGLSVDAGEAEATSDARWSHRTEAIDVERRVEILDRDSRTRPSSSHTWGAPRRSCQSASTPAGGDERSRH
jgi:SAM-dependent methyltransferase